jgi:pimeloyl-ACP methyl ester carboxylesterase
MTNYFVNQLALHQNHRLIFYDQRGSMRSPCRDINSVSVRSHVKDLEFIRQKLKIDSFKIIAHSMGSYLALKYLGKHPEKVKGFLGIGAVSLKGDLFGNAEKKNQFRSDVLESDKFKKVMDNHDLKFENRYEYSDKKKSLINQLASAAANVYDSSKWYCHEGSFTFNQKIAQQTALTMGRWFDHNIRFLDILRLKVFNKGWDFTSTINDLEFEPYYITSDYDFINKLSGGILKDLNETKSGHVFYLENTGHNAWIDRPETVKNIIKNRWLKD